MLEVRNLCAGYGKVPVLVDVSLHVERGECVAVLGSNNAGKTTLLRTISGLVRPSSGSIVFDGEDVAGARYDTLVKRGIAQIPEGRHVFAEMSVEDNLLVGATRLPAARQRRRLREILEMFPLLAGMCRKPAAALSGGQQQMMVIARALMGEPALLLVDEPSLGLSPVAIDAVIAIFASLRAAGSTILLAEQNAALSLELCDRGYVLQRGRVALAGTRETLRGESLETVYLA